MYSIKEMSMLVINFTINGSPEFTIKATIIAEIRNVIRWWWSLLFFLKIRNVINGVNPSTRIAIRDA